ncbi:hypothetical protein HY490_05185 [Candidatus Woesearchaeota archaeon]|nr:hypothetical protein [Candidatus Woesearchaeota archaeon]
MLEIVLNYAGIPRPQSPSPCTGSFRSGYAPDAPQVDVGTLSNRIMEVVVAVAMDNQQLPSKDWVSNYGWLARRRNRLTLPEQVRSAVLDELKPVYGRDMESWPRPPRNMVWLMLQFTSDPDVSKRDAYWCRTLGDSLREMLGNVMYAVAAVCKKSTIL